jgi:hypothetical protein
MLLGDVYEQMHLTEFIDIAYRAYLAWNGSSDYITTSLAVTLRKHYSCFGCLSFDYSFHGF